MPIVELGIHSGHQDIEPFGQHGLGDLEVGEEVAEAADPVEGVSHDQQRPALPDDLEGAGERALLVGVVAGKTHAPILAQDVQSPNKLLQSK